MAGIAAGNSGQVGVVAPGCISTAITVGATNNSDAVAGVSQRSPLLDFFAPGVGINSSISPSSYGVKSGTSMATPHVAGAFAVLRARFAGNTVSDNAKVLTDTGVNISFSNAGTTYNIPRIRLCRYYLKFGTTWYCVYIFLEPWIIAKLQQYPLFRFYLR